MNHAVAELARRVELSRDAYLSDRESLFRLTLRELEKILKKAKAVALYLDNREIEFVDSEGDTYEGDSMPGDIRELAEILLRDCADEIGDYCHWMKPEGWDVK